MPKLLAGAPCCSPGGEGSEVSSFTRKAPENQAQKRAASVHVALRDSAARCGVGGRGHAAHC
eukprot:6318091-Prymnesium_polylepis.1